MYRENFERKAYSWGSEDGIKGVPLLVALVGGKVLLFFLF